MALVPSIECADGTDRPVTGNGHDPDVNTGSSCNELALVACVVGLVTLGLHNRTSYTWALFTLFLTTLGVAYKYLAGSTSASRPHSTASPPASKSPRAQLPSPPLTPLSTKNTSETMVFTKPTAVQEHDGDQTVSRAPLLVSSFVDKYRELRAAHTEAVARADKFEKLYTELKARADALGELEASLPSVRELKAELEREVALKDKAVAELDALRREQDELLAMH